MANWSISNCRDKKHKLTSNFVHCLPLALFDSSSRGFKCVGVERHRLFLSLFITIIAFFPFIFFERSKMLLNKNKIKWLSDWKSHIKYNLQSSFHSIGEKNVERCSFVGFRLDQWQTIVVFLSISMHIFCFAIFSCYIIVFSYSPYRHFAIAFRMIVLCVNRHRLLFRFLYL